MDKALNINSYVNDGFVKVCKVQSGLCNSWWYSEINEPVMFAQHKSWVYFIVVNNEIVKVGETGNPLGIKMKNSNQPKFGKEGRFGRYRGRDGTDAYIRESLDREVNRGMVTLWARRCEMVSITVSVCGQTEETLTSFHKDLEMRYLDYIFSQTGVLPRLNKSRK